MRKIDIIFAILSGEGVAWLVSGILRDYGVETGILVWVLAVSLPILTVLGVWVAYLIGQRFLFVFQLAKFVLIGVLATLLDLGVFKLLGLAFLLNVSLIKGISFLVATFAKYWGNKFWAFEKKEKEGIGREIIQFYIFTAVGLAINVGAFSFLLDVVGPQFGAPLEAWKTIAVIIAAIVVSAWNFLTYKFIVFKTKK